MLRNILRSKGESRALSWLSPTLYARDKMSDLGMIQESGPYNDGPEMFNRDCSECIMPEKSTFHGGTEGELEARK